MGARHVVPALSAVLEDPDGGLLGLVRSTLAETGREIREIEARLRSVERQLEAVAEQLPVVGLLRSIPGIGVDRDGTRGCHRRRPAVSVRPALCQLPRPDAARARQGHRRRLGAISKRGDVYLRMLLIHGARAVLCHAKTKTAPPPDRLRSWALELERLRGHNKAAVALANKLARIAWAVWKTGHAYTSVPAS